MTRPAAPCALRLTLTGSGSHASRVSAALVAAIAEGQLDDGDLMPSTRTLAEHIGVARSAVVSAYEELVAAGYLVSRGGSGTHVERGAARAARAGAYSSTPGRTITPDPKPPAKPEATTPRAEFNLLPGFPDTTLVNRREWNRAWRAAVNDALFAPTNLRLNESVNGSYHEFYPELREALAGHLRLSRGIVCDPADLFLFPGVNNAIRVLAKAMLDDGASFAFEDPGYASGRRVLQHAGYRIRPIPVDGAGFDVTQLRRRDRAVYVTPAHQFPLGARMPVERRTELLDWATSEDALIFEDDYDGEFRYDVAPMPALRSMSASADSVIYIGTASKSIARDLRIAWAVVPSRFRAEIRRHLFIEGDSVNPIAAAALNNMLRSGALLRQIASLQRTYAARRERLALACAAQMPEIHVRGVEAGLHMVLTSDTPFDDARAVERLLDHGLACTALSSYYLDPDQATEVGLVCGYSRLPETRASDAVAVIKEVLTDFIA